MRRAKQTPLVLGPAAIALAGREQGETQVPMQLGVIGHQVQPAFVVGDRLRPFALPQQVHRDRLHGRDRVGAEFQRRRERRHLPVSKSPPSEIAGPGSCARGHTPARWRRASRKHVGRLVRPPLRDQHESQVRVHPEVVGPEPTGASIDRLGLVFSPLPPDRHAQPRSWPRHRPVSAGAIPWPRPPPRRTALLPPAGSPDSRPLGRLGPHRLPAARTSAGESPHLLRASLPWHRLRPIPAGGESSRIRSGLQGQVRCSRSRSRSIVSDRGIAAAARPADNIVERRSRDRD